MNPPSARDGSSQGEPMVEQNHGTRDRWLVLMVDDEPEIHEITKLVLANTSFSGLPVELHSVYSAADAMVFLGLHRDTALMLLDVVMETDDAGLRLVQYVREELGNSDVQIVLRTGQPGMAPEREVIPVYDINGYFLKTEMVAQKLQSIVISSLRTYKYIKTLRRKQGDGAAPPRTVSDSYRRQALEEEFSKAIETNAPQVLAQPQVNLDSGELAAIEILPNWRVGDAMLDPAQLVDKIRDPELRLKFDDWVLGQACAWMRSWRLLNLPPFRVSLRLLSENIGDCRILSIVQQNLSRTAVAPGHAGSGCAGSCTAARSTKRTGCIRFLEVDRRIDHIGRFWIGSALPSSLAAPTAGSSEDSQVVRAQCSPASGEIGDRPIDHRACAHVGSHGDCRWRNERAGSPILQMGRL